MEKLEEYAIGDCTVFAVKGDLDHCSAPALQPLFARQLTTDSRLLLDLRGCAYVDSGGLGMLLALVSHSADGRWLGVIGPNRNIRRLFELAGLLDYASFHVFADEHEAEAYLRS